MQLTPSEVSLVWDNSRGIRRFLSILSDPAGGLNAACVLEFSHAREARNKEREREREESPGFRWLRTKRWGHKREARRGWQCLASLVRIVPSLLPLPHPLSHPTHFCRQCWEEILERSWRDSGSREYGCQGLSTRHTHSLSPSLSLSLCAVSFFVVIARSSPLSLTISRVPHSSSSLGCCSLFFSHLT